MYGKLENNIWNSETLGNCLKDVRGKKKLGEPLKKHTTLQIGGKADALIFPKDIEDVRLVQSLSREQGIPVTVLGFGTNILVRDGGIRGIVLSFRKDFGGLTVERDEMKVSAGISVKSMVSMAQNRALSGLEFMAGIPGSFGGAVVMNAGTGEGEIGNVITSITVMDREGEICELSQKEIGFSYRETDLAGKYTILQGRITLKKGYRNDIREKVLSNMMKKKETQPLHKKSAGCVFKNPQGFSAGKLIDDSGLKGFRIGGLKVSQTHANFIINEEQGNARDMCQLIEVIKEKVLKDYGVELTEEIHIIGEENEK